MNRISNIHSAPIWRQYEPTLWVREAIPPEPRKSMENMEALEMSGDGMDGAGIGDRIRALFKKGKAVAAKGSYAANKLDNLVNGSIGTKVVNSLSARFNKNPNARPKFPGERHIVLPTKHGLTMGNFIGPGTQLQKRLARGDKPVDPIFDRAAMIHDVAYSKARSLKDVHVADQAFNRAIEAGKEQYPKFTSAIQTMFKAKQLAEKFTNKAIVQPNAEFTGQGVTIAGSGRRRKTACSRLRCKMLKKVKAQREHGMR